MARFNSYLTWILTIGSAALCADIGAASLEAYLHHNPQALELSPSSRPAAFNLGAQGRQDMHSVLRQPPEPKPKYTGPKKRRVSVHGADAKDKDQMAEDKRDISKGVLQGTLISPAMRAAILELGLSSIAVVAQGDTIGGYTLAEVGSAWARFENDKEELLFVADSLSLGTDAKDKKKGSGPIVTKRPTTAEAEEEPQEEEEKEQEEEKGERVTLAEVRAALDNSAAMARQLRVVPQEKDGMPYGTRVDFRTADNLLARMGVQDRDVMLSINGVPTRSAEEMYRGYMTLRNAKAFEFVVERDGKEQTIRYELEQ